jgi:protein-tyrosine phosphatase
MHWLDFSRRGAAVVGAYLLATGKATTVEQAVELLRRARPTVVIRKEAMEALRRFTAPESLTDLEPAKGNCGPGR